MVPKEAFAEKGDAEHTSRGSLAQGQGGAGRGAHIPNRSAHRRGADGSMWGTLKVCEPTESVCYEAG